MTIPTSTNHNAGSQRIALFVPSLHGGGAERSAANLAGGMAARGIQVDMVLARARGPYLESLSGDVNVIDLKSSRVLFALPGLVRYLRNNRPHALISFMDHANIIALMARNLSGARTRVIGTVRTDHSARRRHERDGFRQRIVMWITQRVYRSLDDVVAVSRGVARSIAEHTRIPLKSIRVIYNPIVTPELLARAQEPPGPEWRDDERPLVVGVGRLSAAKDFDTLIRAFADVRAKRPSRLLILGEGECRARLEGLVRELNLGDDVSLPGFVTNPHAYLARADVFVLSSRWEGLPGVLVEAMACGTSVVSTDCPSGPDEILVDGAFGPLASVGDPSALATVILHTLDTPSDADRLRSRAEDFSLDRSVDAYLALCGEVGGGAS